MFKSLFGGNKEDKLLKQKVQQIETAFTNEEFDTVISEGDAISEQVSGKKKIHLLKMIALAHFHNKEYEKAIPYFQEMSELENENPDHFYNLCTAHIMSKQPEKGLDFLEKAILTYQEKGKKENLPISYMIFYTVATLNDTGEFDHAFDLMDRLAEIYKKISITDTHFLYTRGFVPFHTFMEKVKDTLVGQKKVDAIEWLNNFSPALDEDGQGQVEELIEDLKVEQELKLKDTE